MQYGMQITSLAVLMVVLCAYFRYNRISLISTRLFTGFLLLSLFNIAAEFATLYTLTHLTTVSPFLNRLCHQLFIGSLDGVAFCLYLYVDLKARKQKRYTIGQLILRLIPLAVALVVVIFGDLEYHVGTDGLYSYGSMATTVYITYGIYLALLVWRLRAPTAQFTRKERLSLLCGVLCWTVLAVIQFFRSTLLLSSMGITLMVLFVFISFENPREYLDWELDGALNRQALRLALSELTESKQQFYIVSLLNPNATAAKGGRGAMAPSAAFGELDTLFGPTTPVYHFQNHAICILLRGKKTYESFMEKQLPIIRAQSDGQTLVCVLECPKYAATADEALDMLTFAADEGARNAQSDVLMIDDTQMNRRNYLSAVERMACNALLTDGFEVHFQPIYSAATKRFSSAEALVRLKDRETLGFVSPGLFVPMLEKKNLIQELDQLVFEKVCAFAAENELWRYGVEYVEVNLSGAQSADERLSDEYGACMKRYGIKPSFINFEITETASAEEGDFSSLRALGCKFSMDDFGTGYSNLASIVERQFNLIKLDKSLIWPCFEEDNENALIVLRSCLGMVNSLGISMVAEGVETKEQADWLIAHGVQHLQGYHYSRPLSGEQLIDFLNEHLEHDNTETPSE